ncbi:NfeD family protein [Marinoscillum furvescens]|uniref:NfeD-like partner-binding protein n=1 Tax=Marinoscillum furvescens DSM 4134 TaxID=1122208 RepID=A0A3D9LHL7_MARFU|nr:NfeD family protein [Marinoscillum furvescens]REE06004.1 NfeD-like partner-binding protein [Marinoscillum furvescens DSM 4134]
MDWITVIGLLIFGIALIVIEVIFVPGTTIVGIAGFVVSGFSVYLCYDYFGSTTGNIFLAVAAISGMAAVILSFRSNAWQKLSLKDVSSGKSNDLKHKLSIGDEGKTISSLKPFGKAEFQNHIVEVKSNGSWIDEGIEVKISRIVNNRITVEPIN